MVAEARAAEGQAVIEQRPDHRAGDSSRRTANQPSPSVTSPNMKMNIATNDDWERDDHDVDEERDDAARQHALEKFGLGRRIVGVRLDLELRRRSARGSLSGMVIGPRPSEPKMRRMNGSARKARDRGSPQGRNLAVRVSSAACARFLRIVLC